MSVTNHLIASDLPAPPSYRERKAELFAAIEPGWAPFFADAGSDIDWRLVSWGGVQIDDRRAGDREPCPRGCIPALDDPALTGARAGDWYPDGRTMFGVIVGDEAVAFPKNIMEVHEMVNVTVGGHRLGIPYCTLCGSAQAYDLDSVPEGVRPPVLRTSGLLSRSNKLMYDLNSSSAIDTFTGRALSGRLQDARVVLAQVSVVTVRGAHGRRRTPGRESSRRTAGSAADTPRIPSAGATKTGRSSRSATSIRGCRSKPRCSASSPPTASPSPSPPTRPARRWTTARRSASAPSSSSPTAAACVPAAPPAPRSPLTRRSGSPGVSSIPAPGCGRRSGERRAVGATQISLGDRSPPAR